MTDNTSIHKCNLCNKNYSSKYNLNKHLEKCKVKITSENELNCEFCNKIYSSKSTLKNHYQKCLHKKLKDTELKHEKLIIDNDKIQTELKNEINNLKNENFNLQQEKFKLEIELKLRSEISTGNTTITNNYTSNNNNNNNFTLKQIVSKLEPICYEEIKSSMSNFANDYIDDGIKGFARFLCDFGCNNKIVTTDNSRHTIAYRTKFDDFIRDPECVLLINNTLKNNSDEIIYKAEERRKYYLNHANYDSFSKRIMRIIELKKLAEASVKEKPDDNIKAISNLLCEHGLRTFHNNKNAITV